MKPEHLDRLSPKERKRYFLSQSRILKDPTFEDELIVRYLESLARSRADLAETVKTLAEVQWRKRYEGTFICNCCGAHYDANIDESYYYDDRYNYIPIGKGRVCKPDCRLAKIVKKDLTSGDN